MVGERDEARLFAATDNATTMLLTFLLVPHDTENKIPT